MPNVFTSVMGLIGKPIQGILRWRPWRDNYGPGIRRHFDPDSAAIVNHEQALTVPAYTAALQRVQRGLGRLPLLTYKEVAGHPQIAKDHPAYYILNQRANPAMSRTHLLHKVVYDVWQWGDFYAQLLFAKNHKLLGIYPIDPEYVIDIRLEDDWTRTYVVKTMGGVVPVKDENILHIHFVSRVGLGNGIRGCPMWLECAEVLGLSRQVIESATAYYQNAMNPSAYATFPGKLRPETRAELSDDLHQNYGGPRNRGKVPILDQDGKLATLAAGSAKESELIKSLQLGTQQAAQITGVSPIQLGDMTAAHYATLQADNDAFYQTSVAPLAEIVEQEVNYKIFGKDSDYFAKFDTDALLRGDRYMQAQINALEIQAGYRLRSEAREDVDLEYLPEMDAITMPINMGGNPNITESNKEDQLATQQENDDQSTTDQADTTDQPNDQ